MRTASDSVMGTVVLLAQKKKLYDASLERHQQAPVLTAQAQAQYDTATANMDAAKASMQSLLDQAIAKSLAKTNAEKSQAEPLRKAAQVQKDLASSYELKLPTLRHNVEVLKSNEKLNVPQLKKLEGELAEAVGKPDFMQAAALVTGGSQVAVEK
jgi:flagellar biosynthesis component FlhA